MALENGWGDRLVGGDLLDVVVCVEAVVPRLHGVEAVVRACE